MKKLTTFLFTVLFLGQIFAQTDQNGNPIFNSISTGEKAIDNFLLISNYYTLENNIANKQSSVFIAEKPTLAQVEQAAIELPSDFFILTKESKMVVMIMLKSEHKKEWMTISMATNQQEVFPAKLKGDITENRANEIIKQNYDTTATIADGKLYFNGNELVIITNQAIEKAILKLIKSKKLDQQKVSDIVLPSQKELKTYILTESKKGGELDFFTEIEGKEMDGVQIKPGVFTTKQGVALYKWGRACFEIGVNLVEDAYEIYTEVADKAINQRSKEYIKMGFYKEWGQ